MRAQRDSTRFASLIDLGGPERFADSQISLAPRAPSIHDPTRSSAGQFAVMHNTTVLDFFGVGSRRGRKLGLSCSGFLSTDNGSAQEFRITETSERAERLANLLMLCLGQLGAVDVGYRVIIVRDAICSSSDEGHDALMEVYHSRFSEQIETANADEILDAWS